MMKEKVLSQSIRLIFSSGVAVGLSIFSPLSFAQTTNAGDSKMQRVEITGSSIKRVAVEGSLPVTVMGREEIERTGAVSVEELVQMLSSNSSAGGTQGAMAAGLSTYGLSSISLRGLGETRTLVLLNGERLATFGGTGSAVDINAIPMSAIQRIEILRDGASALYGSDAVGGVVNFILRDDYKGFEAGASYEFPTRGGGGVTKQINGVFGVGKINEDRYNLMISASAEKGSALYGRDRDFSKTGNISPYIASAATESGRIEGVWVPGVSLADNKRNTSTNFYGISNSGWGNPSAPNNCADINMYSSGKGGVDGQFDNCKFDAAPFVGLFPESERNNVVGGFKFQITPTLQFFSDMLYAQSIMTEAFQPAPLSTAFMNTDNAFAGSGVDPALLIRPSNPNYASVVTPYLNANGLGAMNGQTLAVTSRTFLVGPRTQRDKNTQTRFLAGLKGTISDWDYKVHAVANESKTEGKLIDGYFSMLAVARILNDPASNWNPWASGGAQDPALTQRLQEAKYVGPTLTGVSKSNSAQATLSGTLKELPAGPLQLAAGVNARRDSYTVTVPDILSSGDIAGLGGATSPVDASRTVKALFSELNIPITKTLEGNIAGRVDRYSDVGSTQNGKASLRFSPTSNLVLRGSFGTGFRAPTLYEMHQPITTGTTEQFTDPAFPLNGQIQANALIGGNPNLKPEKSKQAGLGIVVAPLPNFTIGLDWYRIKIDQWITKPAALTMVTASRAGSPLYDTNDVTFNPDGTVDTVNQINRNAASALTSGLDVDIHWSQKFSKGKLSIDLNGTYVNTFDYTAANGTIQHSVGTIVDPDGNPLDVAGTGVIVRWKHNLAFNWTSGPWSTTFIQNYYSRYRDANNQIDNQPHYVPAQALYDVSIAYTGVKNLKLSMGVKNLFDKDPPLFIGNGSSFQSGYDPTMYDPRARTVYLSANYKFW